MKQQTFGPSFLQTKSQPASASKSGSAFQPVQNSASKEQQSVSSFAPKINVPVLNDQNVEEVK